jgi:hypothetical protein
MVDESLLVKLYGPYSFFESEAENVFTGLMGEARGVVAVAFG